MTRVINDNKQEENQSITSSEESPNPYKHTTTVYSSVIVKIAYFSITIILAITGSIFYTNYQLAKHDKDLSQKLNQIEIHQVEMQSNLNQSSERIANEIQQKLKNIKQTLNSAIQEKWYQTNDWVMLKAKYYLELAAINAKWTDDYLTSSQLLEEADIMLKNIPGDKIVDIRQKIAAELLAINKINKVDHVKILSTISAIQKDLPSISTQTFKAVKQENAIQTKSKDWQEHFQNNLKKLSKIVIIKNNSDKLNSLLLTPQYLQTLTENIRLNLQQAQLAVIEQDQEVYELAIQQALDNIKRGYISETTETKSVIEKLTELLSYSIKNPKPEIGVSLTMLNSIINNKSKE
ncbi:MAG: hypothetical protein A3E88_05370 [Legionellales bacterium RIFCSPHIGHO2_12_FULL_35_11]|nr:MAG: hypothetical protein A3E88_05370 [Legionellales bacterium RIFCSPHIGHO2_12_FULL_35_11]